MTEKNIQDAIKELKSFGKELGNENSPTIMMEAIYKKFPETNHQEIQQILGEMSNKGKIKCIDSLTGKIELLPQFFEE